MYEAEEREEEVVEAEVPATSNKVEEQVEAEPEPIEADIVADPVEQDIPTVDLAATEVLLSSRSIRDEAKERKLPVETPPSASGDPHFVTWNGGHYDYHGACDLVLLYSKQADVRVHLRTKHRRGFSYIASAAVQVGNDVLEVTGNNNKDYYVNGEKKAALPMKLHNHNHIEYHSPVEQQQSFIWNIGQGQKVVVKTWKDFVSVKLEGAKAESFGDSIGLMGSYGTGVWLARDGETIIDDKDVFGQEWQVNADEPVLFQTVESSGSTCPLPPAADDQSSKQRRRLGEAIVTEDMARAACEHADVNDFDFCVYDVMQTGDIEMSGAY